MFAHRTPKTDSASNERSPHPTVAARPSRCVSVPFATVPTFTRRPHLSKELDEKLGKAHGTGLGHAVAVTGLAGTGKTQLVLRYHEEHEEEYDTVLWIDVRSEETARASYERCCRALGLPVEAPVGDEPLQDIPAVQAVLSWLRSRGEDKRWLAVVDNADDLSWDVSSIVPKGKAGTVIVTSQDALASRLLGGRTPTVRVDAMEPEEAVRLMSNYFDEPLCRGNGRLTLVEKITESLDRLALAMDLAGARIRADVENGDDLATALRQYIADYRRSQDRLLRDEEFARISLYKKTVWTAWETSLASLRELEDSQPDIYPIQLLSFLTLLDRANVQDELFRLASLGLEDACDRLNVKLPTWMQGLLSKRENDRWDDFSYRDSVKLLLRYGLVRPVGEPWKGITMHSLVQWRAGVGLDREQYWRLYLAFMVAACESIGEKVKRIQFRRQLVVHLPQNDDLLKGRSGAAGEGLWWIWMTMGRVLRQEGRWREAEELFLSVVETRSRMLGEEHPKTLSAMANLAATYWNQGRWREAEELYVKVLEARRRVLGEEHPDTIRAMANLAATYRKQGRWEEAEELQVKVLEASRRVVGEEHPDTIMAMANLAATYRKQGRWKEAEELEVKVVEVRQRLLGEEHPDTLGAMTNLATTYVSEGHWDEAEELFVRVMVARSSMLGTEHPDTLTTMHNLGATYSHLGHYGKAEGLEVKVVGLRTLILGERHPDTLTSIANLGFTYCKRGRWKEAEELQVKVLDARTELLGKEYPETLDVMACLAITFRNQERLKEAEELEVKVMEARRRVLGEEHPDTITAMANLASTYWNQGRWKEAEELEVGVLEASRRVVGEEHPDTIIAMADLAATYRNQGRSKEAEELQVKVLEARRRVLGEEHPDTIRAMAHLAYMKRDLGQNDVALDLMTRSATASSRVLGYDHPDCRNRYEQATLWSGVISDHDGDDDRDTDEPVHSDDDGGVAVS
jgi:tetratricopeptide (TPR) repeat protein